MQFFRNYEHELSPDFDDWIAIASRRNCEPTEDEFWELLVQFAAPPLLANVYQGLLLRCIKESVQEQFPDLNVSYYINASDSHLYINDQAIHTLEEFDAALACVERESESQGSSLLF